MLKFSRLADYGILLLANIAGRAGDGVSTSRELARSAQLPMPTVGKLLKALSRAGLLVSQRGAKGGYRLARAAEEISVAEVVAAIDGPVALTECAAATHDCALVAVCPVGGNLRRVNEAVRQSLEGLKLSQMVRPLPSDFRLPRAARGTP